MSEKVRRMSVKELGALIKETISEMTVGGEASQKDVESEAKKNTEEVEADEYADKLEKKKDHYAGLKIKEHKALLYLESIRRQQLSLQEEINELSEGVVGDKKRQLGRAKMRKDLAKSRDRVRGEEAKKTEEASVRSKQSDLSRKKQRVALAKSRERAKAQESK